MFVIATVSTILANIVALVVTNDEHINEYLFSLLFFTYQFYIYITTIQSILSFNLLGYSTYHPNNLLTYPSILGQLE
jgi:hypothetical protein